MPLMCTYGVVSIASQRFEANARLIVAACESSAALSQPLCGPLVEFLSRLGSDGRTPKNFELAILCKDLGEAIGIAAVVRVRKKGSCAISSAPTLS